MYELPYVFQGFVGGEIENSKGEFVPAVKLIFLDKFTDSLIITEPVILSELKGIVEVAEHAARK